MQRNPSTTRLFANDLLAHKHKQACNLLAALFVLAGLPLAYGENWPSWRGPQGTGISSEKNLPVKWSTNQNVRWRVDLPGPGNSSPIVWGKRVFITQAVKEENRRTVMCLDRDTGKVLWQSGVTYEEKEPTHDTNPYCAGTPVTDGQRVYACFGSAGVYAYDFQGKEVWHRDLGKINHMFGNSVSPILHGDLCILNYGPDNSVNRLIALDKKTGKTVWQVEPPAPDEIEVQQAKLGPGTFIAPQLITDGDKNADEKLSKEELAAVAELWFDKMDPEKAGKLTQEQLIENLSDVFPPPPGSPPPAQGERPRRGRGPGRFIGPGFFSASDLDKDNSLTREELKAAFTKWFGEWDKSQSGILDENTVRLGLNAVLPKPEGGPSGDPSGSWSTPIIIKAKGGDQLIASFPHRLAGFDPKTGKQLWMSKGLGGSVYTTPLWGEGILVAASSGAGPGNAIAVKPGGKGDVTDQERLWRLDRIKGSIGSGVIHEGHYYTLSADGIAECMELATGKRIWDERLKGPGFRNSSWSSMLLVGDTIYVPNQSGDVFVLKAQPRFEEIACNSVNEPTNASLAVSDGAVFLRTDKALWCLENGAPKGKGG